MPNKRNTLPPDQQLQAVQDKRKAILDTTLRLITTQGYHATPMSQIAREAGVAAGTIYHYFSSKEELMSQLYAEVKARMGAALAEDSNHEMSYKMRFWIFWRNMYNYLKHNEMDFWFLELFAVSPIIKAEDVRASARHYQSVIDFLSFGIQKGILREMSPNLMAALIDGQIKTIIRLEIAGHETITDHIIAEVIQGSWDMVRIN